MALTIEAVLDLVRMQLGVRKVSPQDRFAEDLGAESADLVNLVAAAEDSFNVTFDEAEIANVRTAQELFNLLEKLA